MGLFAARFDERIHWSKHVWHAKDHYSWEGSGHLKFAKKN